MPGGATRAPLSGGRWHFQHGPIDLVIGAEGDAEVVAAAYEQAWCRFQPLLAELVAELPRLRLPVTDLLQQAPFRSVVARRMVVACAPFAPEFITPMAAVAGAVAQELIASYQREGIHRAWVNNGGDIALHLAEGASVHIGLFADLSRLDGAMAMRAMHGALGIDGRLNLHASSGVRGVATSGWRGRSHSMGIADSVTVLAATAAMADAAATIIANAVDLDDARVQRRPACELRDDSDLGTRLVTVQVPPLPAAACRAALQAGARRAEACRAQGLILGAALVCQGQLVEVGVPALGAPDVSRPVAELVQ